MPSTPSNLTIPIIGYHRSPLSQKFGMPRQPNLVDLVSHIEMLPPYDTLDAFVGIEDFSHLWITWHTHHNKAQVNFKPQVRPPRLGGNAKLGVFATRSTYRPSALGLSVVRLLAVDKQQGKVVLRIQGADMIDATPIVDIKPYVAYSDAIIDAISGFAPAAPTTKIVKISTRAQHQFSAFLTEESSSNPVNINYLSIQKNDLDIICALIAQDPRPAYRQHEVDQVFIMRYKQVDVHFQMDNEGVLWLVDIQQVV
ncbi:tRNA (N6-threonylcarbamoyladenosine(37)-N6)-methyltransferase TrmO [Psychrobacter sp. I-STPA10]|uniref:tRNA (N6-threonylcarbamoyladenosine(37)-N6)-methyltransferase TrmO n=1 Tax=Psychrobacter sp. I-STPA10 TaxID=2585769 RepID=UPI001E64C123|nr:tRNA (N6-threonylcarbamoyladenosine(37)-N6)-methyltransferase TrmO [Psychrobacter sp. I-STPA10]